MNPDTLLSRRAALALLAATALTPGLPRRSQASAIPLLEFFGPPAGPSVSLARALAHDGFDDIAEESRLSIWRNPDELRAGLTSGRIGASIVPVQAAANLHTRGFPIRLANVMTDGLLYVATVTPDITAIPDLRGRAVAVPFRGDTPALLFEQLLAHHRLDPARDLTISHAASPVEAMQLLLAGRVEAALTAEPLTSAAILRGRLGGRVIHRAIDLQAAWGTMAGTAPVLPQAGLAVTQGFLDAHGAALPAILAAISEATAAVLADPRRAGIEAAGPLGLPAPLIAASVPHCNLVARPAREARGDIEGMLTAMGGEGLERIGGRLPGDAFYL